MPNHVTTKCTVEGPAEDVQRFHDEMIQGEPCFDFNKIIPMPKEVEGTESSSEGYLGLYALRGVSSDWSSSKAHKVSWENWLRGNSRIPQDLKSCEDLIGWLKANNPKALETGEKNARCYDVSGYSDWYGWCIQNWGTKWSAYEILVHEHDAIGGKLVFEFQTAWSFPNPIFEGLPKKYPTLAFSTTSFDEGWIFASIGLFNSTLSFYEYFKPSEHTEKARELHYTVYGRFPEDDDEDED